MENIQKISSALLELKNARLACPQTEKDMHELMAKYNMLFLGEKINTIYSVEFCCTLKDFFGIDITLSDLNQCLPEICTKLGMSYEQLNVIGGTSPIQVPSLSVELF